MTNSIILFVMLLYFLTKFALDAIQIKYIKNMVVSEIELDKLQLNKQHLEKSNLYNIDKLIISMVSLMVQILILYVFLFGGGIDYLSLVVTSLYASEGFIFNFINQELLTLLTFFLMITLIGIPISYYKVFFIEEKYGFNKMTLTLFIRDLIVSLILSILIISFLFLSFLFLYVNFEKNWWALMWLVFIIFNILILYIYPTLISPLFNKFKKINDKNILDAVDTLTNKVNFNIKDVYVMDGSKRSKHSNAYFTGFHKNKRIVFFDTLLESLSVNEITSVLAHEIGHYKEKHILKSIIINMILTLFIFFIMFKLSNMQIFFNAVGVNIISPSSMVITYSLLFPIIGFFITPLLTFFSRKNEYEADNFAKKYSNKNDLISALMKLYKENLSILKPNRLYAAFYYTHPTVFERIKKLNS